jgi:putative transposase
MRLAPQETRTYLVTAVTAQRRRLFQVTATAELLLQTIFDYRSRGRFLLHAFVIMPDHFHVLITPAPDASLEKALQYIKGGFSFRLKSKLDVWMRSFNESQIMSEEKFRSVCSTSKRIRCGAGWRGCRMNIDSAPQAVGRLIPCRPIWRKNECPGLKATGVAPTYSGA